MAATWKRVGKKPDQEPSRTHREPIFVNYIYDIFVNHVEPVKGTVSDTRSSVVPFGLLLAQGEAWGPRSNSEVSKLLGGLRKADRGDGGWRA